MAHSSSPTSAAEGHELLIAGWRRDIDAALRRFCDNGMPDVDGNVADAIRYSLEGEGKRLRALLVCAAYDATGGSGAIADVAASVEIVHAYSLVHDDLPCMDDDDMRRGRPSVHKAFGVRTATAAGVAMVPLAARHAYRSSLSIGLDPTRSAAVGAALMRAAGGGGMIAGQLLDLDAEGRELAVDGLERIHRAKTGALITASVLLGGMCAGAGAHQLEALEDYGWKIGLAFQIADDVLDVTSSSTELGKTAGKDLHAGKSTYPALLGVEAARTEAENLAQSACAALAAADLLTPLLAALAEFSVRRRS